MKTIRGLLAAALACALVPACSALGRLNLTDFRGCVAYGATLKLSGGKLGKSAGCIEMAPYPGEPMPPETRP